MGGCATSETGVTQMIGASLQAGQALTIDEQRETNLGRNVALSLTTRYGLVNDPDLQRY